MVFSVWISFVAVSAVNIVTPGPANLNTLRRALQLGARRVLPTILGNALGLAVGGMACALGLAAVLVASEPLWVLFRGLGGAYLGALGFRLLVQKDELSLDKLNPIDVKAGALFAEAFLLAVSNPKALLFYLALFPQVLDPSQDLAVQAGLLVLTYCGLSVMSLSSYAAMASILRARFLTQSRYMLFRRMSGVVLLCFAVKLLAELCFGST